MTDSAFTPSQETPDNTPPVTSAFEDQLKMIKNEEGSQKYDTVPKALDALAHSQAYIPQLKTENDTLKMELEKMKEELASRQAVSEVVDKITAQQDTQGTPPQVSGLDEQKVQELFQQFNAQQQVQAVATSNQNMVDQALVSKFGDKAQEVVGAKAQELGMTVEGIVELAKTSPQAALQLFQVSGPQSAPPTIGSVNIPPTAPQEEGLQPPEKSLLRGASTKDQVEYLKKIRANVYKKYDIET